MNYNLKDLLDNVIKNGGSDLHLAVNSPPRVRVNGMLLPLQIANLSAADVAKLCASALTADKSKILQERKEVDFALEIPGLARFRVNVFFERGNMAAAFRALSNKVFTMDELRLPGTLKNLCSLKRGLVLVTGPTGSGKSTSLAAMLDHINETRTDHMITIEDPIEYIHAHKKCTVHQRELGEDTLSFANALKSCLRQDPDVILVGEMRDRETIQTAITTAETGHLVFSTLHTNGCVQTMTRIVDVFPSDAGAQIRNQLSLNLSAVISQSLLPGVNGTRHLAMEIMYTTPAIRSLIAEGKYSQIYTYIQSGQEASGMQTMNQSLVALVRAGKVDAKVAIDYSPDQQEFQRLLGDTRRKTA